MKIIKELILLQVLLLPLHAFSLNSDSLDAQKASVEIKHTYVTSLENYLLASEKGLLSDQIKSQSGFLIAFDMTDKEQIQFSHTLHEEKNVCGGYLYTDDYKKDFSEEISSKLFNVSNFPFFNDKKIERKKSVNQVFQKLSSDRYKNFLKTLTEFPDRSASSNNGANAAIWVSEKVDELAAQYPNKLISHFFVQTPRYKQNSLVVKLQGEETGTGGVVMGAHLDTLGFDKPGADDDGSGSSAVFEVLTAILESKITTKKDLYFIFYAAEERGLVGSKYVVEHFVQNAIPVDAVLHLDMIGYSTPNASNKVHFITDNTNSSLTQYTKELAKTYLDKSEAQLPNLKCGYACSDHARWHRAGYPVVYPFETLFNEYNRKIHTSRDNMSLIDIDHAMQFVHLASAFMIEMGND